MRGTPSGKQIVIVGLGNPGKNYARQRHNLGFRVVDELADEAACSWKDNRRKALVCEAGIDTTTGVSRKTANVYESQRPCSRADFEEA